MDQTVILIKPGFPELEQEVLTNIQEHDYSYVRREVVFDRPLTARFYAGKEQYFQEVLYPYYDGQRVIVYIAWGHAVLDVFNVLKWRIRKEKGITEKPRDGIHASDSAVEADRELRALFEGQPCT